MQGFSLARLSAGSSPEQTTGIEDDDVKIPLWKTAFLPQKLVPCMMKPAVHWQRKSERRLEVLRENVRENMCSQESGGKSRCCGVYLRSCWISSRLLWDETSWWYDLLLWTALGGPFGVAGGAIVAARSLCNWHRKTSNIVKQWCQGSRIEGDPGEPWICLVDIWYIQII